MRRDSYSVAMFLELVADGYKRLDVSPTTDNLYDDVEAGGSTVDLLVGRWRICWNFWLVVGRRYQFRQRATESGVEIDVDATII